MTVLKLSSAQCGQSPLLSTYVPRWMEISFIRRYCTSILLTAALSLAASSCSKVYDINRTTSPQFAADLSRVERSYHELVKEVVGISMK
jgi:hypothetical protein